MSKDFQYFQKGFQIPVDFQKLKTLDTLVNIHKYYQPTI